MKFLALIEKNQNAIIGALIIHVLVFVWLNIQQILKFSFMKFPN